MILGGADPLILNRYTVIQGELFLSTSLYNLLTTLIPWTGEEYAFFTLYIPQEEVKEFQKNIHCGVSLYYREEKFHFSHVLVNKNQEGKGEVHVLLALYMNWKT